MPRFFNAPVLIIFFDRDLQCYGVHPQFAALSRLERVFALPQTYHTGDEHHRADRQRHQQNQFSVDAYRIRFAFVAELRTVVEFRHASFAILNLFIRFSKNIKRFISRVNARFHRHFVVVESAAFASGISLANTFCTNRAAIEEIETARAWEETENEKIIVESSFFVFIKLASFAYRPAVERQTEIQHCETA